MGKIQQNGLSLVLEHDPHPSGSFLDPKHPFVWCGLFIQPQDHVVLDRKVKHEALLNELERKKNVEDAQTSSKETNETKETKETALPLV